MHRTRLNSRLDRSLGRYTTANLSGRRYRPPNHLREACKLLRTYLRFAERDRKRHPQDYDPWEPVRRIEERKHREEWERALTRVYGPG